MMKRTGQATERAVCRESRRGQGVRREDATSAITQRLKALYDEVARQPIPERFRTLLERLDDAPTRHKLH